MSETSRETPSATERRPGEPMRADDWMSPARDVRSEEMVVNMGPQHPATHGVLRVAVRTDGEVVLDCEPMVGNLHRCKEKIAENNQYFQFMPYTDRLDYLAAINNEECYARAVEKLCGVKLHERIEWIRVIMSEVSRISSHLMSIGTYGLDVGAFTPFLYCFREREEANYLFEKISGGRMLYHYIRIGGVMRDLDDAWIQACLEFLARVESKMAEYNTLLTWNKVFQERTMHVGVMTQEVARRWCITGPALRATGIDWDVRRDDPYGVYHKFKWKVPVTDGRYGTPGDCWNRHYIRALEIAESISIVRQAIDTLPKADPATYPSSPHHVYAPGVPKFVSAPKGAEAYVRSENPRGELAYYLVSDGGKGPYRCKIRGPGFCNISVLPEICRGYLIADLVAIIGSIDIVLGEVDR
jgi:NADH-quinone oxidoreductase subunit D